MYTNQVLWLESYQIGRWVSLRASAPGNQNYKQPFFVVAVSLSSFHHHKAIRVGFHSSVCNLRFAVKHTLSAGKPQQRMRQEVMESAKQNRRVPSDFHL